MLNTAYADGLLSANTLSHRLDQLYGSLLLDPEPLIGDLSQRTSHRGLWASLQDSIAGRLRVTGTLYWPRGGTPAISEPKTARSRR